MGALAVGTNRRSISSGGLRVFPRGGVRILICGLSASLSGVEWQVGAPLSSARSRVLKSVGSFGRSAFHCAASLAVNRSNVSTAGDGLAQHAARSIHGQILLGIIAYLGSLTSEQYVQGAGAAVDRARGHERHDIHVPAQPQVHGGLEHRAARARAIALAVNDSHAAVAA